jgi:hypothetical protein
MTKEWTTTDAAFRSVATIVIPTQEIDGPGLNRLRLAVYQASIARRRQGAI